MRNMATIADPSGTEGKRGVSGNQGGSDAAAE
jgi:hypothetical protein